jgi:hypothetical protein
MTARFEGYVEGCSDRIVSLFAAIRQCFNLCVRPTELFMPSLSDESAILDNDAPYGRIWLGIP